MAASDAAAFDKPQQVDLDRCVHCGLCLNACPTYRELHVEMDSPRGRIYQMVQVSAGAPVSQSYIEHIELCLACRGCESACPSGVQYGRLVEAARADIENRVRRPWLVRRLRSLVFRRLLPSRMNLEIVGALLFFFQASGLKRLVAMLGFLPERLREVEGLAPEIETPFFFGYYGKTLPAEGAQRYRVAFLGGCIANISFARLNEATVRVLQKNGCEVSIPDRQGCCGALHVHAGIRDEARKLARRNIDALARRRIRRHHHQRGRLRVHVEGIRRTVRARSGVLREGKALFSSGEGRERVSGIHRPESRDGAAADDGDLSGLLPPRPRPKNSFGAPATTEIRSGSGS